MLNFIGFLMPAFIDLINKHVEDSNYRFWISVIACSLVGCAIAAIETNGFKSLSPTEVAELLSFKTMAIVGMAQISYRGIGYKGSDLQKTIRQ